MTALIEDTREDFWWSVAGSNLNVAHDPLSRWKQVGSYHIPEVQKATVHDLGWRWVNYQSSWVGANYLSLRRKLPRADGTYPTEVQSARTLEPGDYIQFSFVPWANMNQHMVKIYATGDGGARRTDIEHTFTGPTTHFSIEIADDTFSSVWFPRTPVFEPSIGVPMVVRWVYQAKNPNKQNMQVFDYRTHAWLNSAETSGYDMIATSGDVTVGSIWFEKQTDGSNNYSFSRVKTSWEPALYTVNAEISQDVAAFLNAAWDVDTYPGVTWETDPDVPHAAMVTVLDGDRLRGAVHYERVLVEITHADQGIAAAVMDLLDAYPAPVVRSRLVRQVKSFQDMARWYSRIEVNVQR